MNRLRDVLFTPRYSLVSCSVAIAATVLVLKVLS